MAKTISTADTQTAELAGARTERVRVKRGIQWGRVAAWAAMVLLLFVSLFPFFWMIRTALSTNADLVTGSQSYIPDESDAAERPPGARARVHRGVRRRPAR